MSDIEIKVDNSEKVKKMLAQNVDRALEALGIQCEGYAKLELENSPRRIDTGLLRNSITHAVSGGNPVISTYHADNGSKSGQYSGTAPNDEEGKRAVYVGTNVEYGVYVHEGAKGMAPNRFLKNSLTKHTDEYKKIAEQYLNQG